MLLRLPERREALVAASAFISKRGVVGD